MVVWHLPPCLTGETDVFGHCVSSQAFDVIQEALTQVLERLQAIMGQLPAAAQTLVQKFIDLINSFLHPAPATTAYTYAYY